VVSGLPHGVGQWRGVGWASHTRCLWAPHGEGLGVGERVIDGVQLGMRVGVTDGVRVVAQHSPDTTATQTERISAVGKRIPSLMRHARR
jgi:hypothetical protein